MIVTTTNEISGFEIDDYKGLVVASQVAGTNVFTDFTASLSDFFGGTSGVYRGELEDLFANVRKAIEIQAREKGANAIIGFHIDFDEISGKGKSMLMLTCYGTAVTIIPNRYDQLKKLHELFIFRKDGIITEEEYEYEKNHIHEISEESIVQAESRAYFEQKKIKEAEELEKQNRIEEACLKRAEINSDLASRLETITQETIDATQEPDLGDDMNEDIMNLVKQSRISEALKYYMEQTGLGLDDAKDYVIYLISEKS